MRSPGFCTMPPRTRVGGSGLRHSRALWRACRRHTTSARSLDYERGGDELGQRFQPGSDQLWYYGALAALFERRRPNLHARELSRSVIALSEAMLAAEGVPTLER